MINIIKNVHLVYVNANDVKMLAETHWIINWVIAGVCWPAWAIKYVEPINVDNN